MDLISEASSNGKILAARHLTNEQAVTEATNAVNTSLHCYTLDVQPDFNTYVKALHVYAPVLLSCAGLAVICTLVVFALSLKATYKRRPMTFTNATFVLAIYPVVAIAGFLTLVVPRARMISEALSQQAVMIGMYHLFCLLIAECGGAEQLVRCAEGALLETRVLPCCCWPCCLIPRPELHKSKLRTLKYLVLQMPVIQAMLYVVILVLWSENVNLFIRSFVYIQVFIATSILFGVWGMIMCVKAVESAGARPKARFLAIQIPLLIVKLQCGMVKLLPEVITIPCLLAIHPLVFINLLHNCAMIVEMFLLSLWAWRLYSVNGDKFTDKIQHTVVAVLEDAPNLTPKKS